MSLKKTSSALVADTPSVVLIERADWKAIPPRSVENWKKDKVTNIVMTTTNTDVCKSKEECIVRMQEIQKQDMEAGEPDIKYNFLVAGDGNVYEGRGWRVSARISKKDGDKFSHLDGDCVYIAFIGPRDLNPSSDMFTAMSGISSYGVDNNMIGSDVKIIRIDGDNQKVYDLNLNEALQDEQEMVNLRKKPPT